MVGLLRGLELRDPSRARVHAIRNAAALIDVTPLYKYRITGRDATKSRSYRVTRDLKKVSVGSVIYTPWCDERGG